MRNLIPLCLDRCIARGNLQTGAEPMCNARSSLRPLQLINELGQMRWLLYEQEESSISMPLLIVVVSWLAVMFISVGLYAPPNSTVIVALMLAAMSVAGAIFLILELDMPFDGILRISSAPMRNALEHLGQ